MDLITACDMRLCSADAVFSVREVRIAIVADVGTLQRLPRIVGEGHARELCYTGDDIGAEHAQRIGLVNHVYPDRDSLIAAAQALAARIAKNSPLAVQGTKTMLVQASETAIREGPGAGRHAQHRLPDQRRSGRSDVGIFREARGHLFLVAGRVTMNAPWPAKPTSRRSMSAIPSSA